jgi:hypothetical protein
MKETGFVIAIAGMIVLFIGIMMMLAKLTVWLAAIPYSTMWGWAVGGMLAIVVGLVIFDKR